jgi:hypothetical protein
MHFPPELTWGIGIILLFVAMAWGAIQYSRRNKANEPLSELATHELHAHPETYEETREELKKRVLPS